MTLVDDGAVLLTDGKISLSLDDLAFDHKDILQDALEIG